jgi:hypothetical protein
MRTTVLCRTDFQPGESNVKRRDDGDGDGDVSAKAMAAEAGEH